MRIMDHGREFNGSLRELCRQAGIEVTGHIKRCPAEDGAEVYRDEAPEPMEAYINKRTRAIVIIDHNGGVY